MQVWQTTTLESARMYRWVLGPLQLWLYSLTDELHLASQRDEALAEAHRVTPLEPGEPSADDLTWSRWIVAPGGAVRLAPVMPDRAVVARPESALRLPAGAAALFFVSVPVWVRLVQVPPGPSDAADVTLTEIPSMVLSNIWFGDPMSGELCYSLTTTARRQIDQAPSRPHRALCPVYMRNAAAEELDVQRIRVPMGPLALFDAGERLWTNRVNVTHQGAEAGSQVDIAPGPPAEADGEARVIGEPRAPARKRFWMRAFGALGSMFQSA